MGDIGTKIDKFIEIFINNRGYVKVLEGLKNTLIIAVIGLVIGVVIGTCLRCHLPVLRRIVPWNSYGCTVVGILLCIAASDGCTYDRRTGIYYGIWLKQWCIHLRDHAKRYPLRRSGTDGRWTCDGFEFCYNYAQDRHSTGSQEYPANTWK